MIFPYKLAFSDKAARALEQLPKNIHRRIWNKLQRAKLNPTHFLTRLEGRADYKLRVGDYRIIADLVPAERLIKITKIGHRRNVYENL